MSKRSKKSSRSNQSSIKEQKTQSGSKRGGGGSNRSKKSLIAAPTQHSQQKSQSQNEGKTQKTQKTIAPPDEDKFDKMKEEAIKARKSQITQITEAKSMAKREIGYDKTQWEFTKWADEAVKPTDNVKPACLTIDVPLGLAPPKEATAQEVPGENRQAEGEKGDYLLDLPLISLILNGIELLFTFLSFILSNIANGAGGMEVFGVYVTSINLILCFVGAGFITFWQWKHKDVAEEESKQGIKHYYVRGCSKKMYFHLHYWRMILYFLTFVILLYYGNCGDEYAGFNYEGYCRKGAAAGLFFASGFLSMFSIIPTIIHLVYIKKGIFAIVAFCRAN
uniref:Transmembrane protein n=1 Tax=Panagrolaimus sp. ES5 TaxID=591445 RepID=A0AC34GX01_9BILA